MPRRRRLTIDEKIQQEHLDELAVHEAVRTGAENEAQIRARTGLSRLRIKHALAYLLDVGGVHYSKPNGLRTCRPESYPCRCSVCQQQLTP